MSDLPAEPTPALQPDASPDEGDSAALERDKSLQLTITVDGKRANWIGAEGISKGKTPDEFISALAALVLHDGAEAVARVHGPEAARRWEDTIYVIHPPEKNETPVYSLFVDILENKASGDGWSWHIRRSDRTIVFVHESSGTRHSVSPKRVTHYMLCALWGRTAQIERAEGAFLASVGIPYVNKDPANLATGGPEEGLPPMAAAAEETFLRGAIPLLSGVDAMTAKRRALLLNEQREATDPFPEKDDEPAQVKALVDVLRPHPIHALRLARELLGSPARRALLAESLEGFARGPGQSYKLSRGSITVPPPRPTLEQTRKDMAWRENASEENIQKWYRAELNGWRRLFAKVSVERSNQLTTRAIDAMKSKKGEYRDAESALRLAVRPWRETGWKGVQVGTTNFGPKPKTRKSDRYPPYRPANTPLDFYRAIYLFAPSRADFDDMYKSGLFGITSPCRRFAMSFYFHKFEFAAAKFVKKGLAVRTRDEGGPFRIVSGVPGSDNGVGTTDKDAIRWFGMIERALCREWSIYLGNNFKV